MKVLQTDADGMMSRTGHLWLLGDIGGTYSRLALWDVSAALPEPEIFANADFSGVDALLDAGLRAHPGARPHRALLAVAGPVDAGSVRITNLGWHIVAARLIARLGLDGAELVNDFTAAALGIPDLPDTCLIPLGGASARADAPIAVLGPGTGLGISGLVPCPAGWTAISGEGGHRSLAPANAREWQVLEAFAARHGHVSAERVVSGPGLHELYLTLASLAGEHGECATPAAVSAAAIAGSDRHAVAALDMFFALLGSVAGDLALTLGAHGGVYLAGGILPRLVQPLKRSQFRERFLAKGRYRAYLESIPVWLVDDPLLSFRGLLRRSRT